MAAVTRADARASEPIPDGVLLVDKPEGPTSHDVVGWVRWALGVKQVGHCGTLDPLATGLLVVCVGAATRLVPYLTGVDKIYRARFMLGRATTTVDREGTTTAERAVTAEEIGTSAQVLRDMVGDLCIPPPAFSAVRVDGQRAHARSRRGETVELPPRPMALRAADDVAVVEDGIEATCAVSKGTYIRSLAEELGRRTGIPCHLAALRRLACSPLRVDDPRTVGGLLVEHLPPRPDLPPTVRLRLPGEGDARSLARARLSAALVAPAAALPFPVEAVGQDVGALAGLLHGQKLAAAALPAAPSCYAEGLGEGPRRGLMFPGGALVVVCLADGAWRPERVIRTSVSGVGPSATA